MCDMHTVQLYSKENQHNLYFLQQTELRGYVALLPLQWSLQWSLMMQQPA